jgi:hypothetical protein
MYFKKISKIKKIIVIVRCGLGSSTVNLQSPSELRQIRHSGQFDEDQVTFQP